MSNMDSFIDGLFAVILTVAICIMSGLIVVIMCT